MPVHILKAENGQIFARHMKGSRIVWNTETYERHRSAIKAVLSFLNECCGVDIRVFDHVKGKSYMLQTGNKIYHEKPLRKKK